MFSFSNISLLLPGLIPRSINMRGYLASYMNYSRRAQMLRVSAKPVAALLSSPTKC